MRFYFCLLLSFCGLALSAAEVIPAKPSRYFVDEAHVVNQTQAGSFNAQLEDFEKTSGNQFVVAVYPKMQSDDDIAAYTIRVARAWGVGQKGTNNGVILFIFIQDRKMFIQVGYGLEGALPDGLCKQITEFEIKPHFKQGDYAGGIAAGIASIIAASRHEYKGNGTTIYGQTHGGSGPGSFVGLIPWAVFILIFFIAAISRNRSGRRGWIFGGNGVGGAFIGGGWGGGGGSSGGGGGFSGGGGSFGGGGAGSGW